MRRAFHLFRLGVAVAAALLVALTLVQHGVDRFGRAFVAIALVVALANAAAAMGVWRYDEAGLGFSLALAATNLYGALLGGGYIVLKFEHSHEGTVGPFAALACMAVGALFLVPAYYKYEPFDEKDLDRGTRTALILFVVLMLLTLGLMLWSVEQ